VKNFSVISLGCFRNTYDSQILAQKYLDPENFVLVVVADEKEAAIKDDYTD